MTLKDERGVSLVEMMITLVVVMAVLGITTQILVQSGRAFTNGQATTDIRTNNTAGIDMIERLVRQATGIVADPDGNGVFDSIRVTADWNPRDGNVTGPYETVTFTVAGGMLMVQDSTMGAPVVYSEGVNQLRFTYADYQGAALPAATVTGTPARIGMVGIALTAPPVDGLPPVVTSTTVAIRRVK